MSADNLGRGLVVEFSQQFTVTPPEEIEDPDRMRDWFWSIYSEIGYDAIRFNQKDDYEIVEVRGPEGEDRETIPFDTRLSFWDGPVSDILVGKGYSDLRLVDAEVVGDYGDEWVELEFAADLIDEDEDGGTA